MLSSLLAAVVSVVPMTVAAGTSAIIDRQAAPSAIALHGREPDGRVAAIAFRLATLAASRCDPQSFATGMALQHLSQFERQDRPALAAALRLDRGPGVAAVVAGSPADTAGIAAGDTLLVIEGAPLPQEKSLDLPFDAARARTRADVVDALVDRQGPLAITVLRRSGSTDTVELDPRRSCPAHVHLARSEQLNAFADGRHVFLTTGLLARLANDDEVAFVIAHEMAHNILHHADLMRSGVVGHGLARTMGHSGEVVRQSERDADHLGGEIMIDAGFDPVVGVMAVRKLGGGDLGLRFLASHDGARERIEAMRALKAERAQL